VLELNEKQPPIKFQKKIIERFPIIKEVKGEIVQAGMKAGNELFISKTDKVSWEFFNKDRTKKVFIDSNFIFVEYYKYKHFRELHDDMSLIFNTFIEQYPVKIINRIGLRYINEIHLPSGKPLDWIDLIHPSFHNITNEFIEESDKLIRLMHLLEIKEEKSTLRFSFGLFNSEYPSPIARKEFILDYDCSLQEEMEISGLFSIGKDFNNIIHKWFERSILEGLRDIMEVIKDE